MISINWRTGEANKICVSASHSFDIVKNNIKIGEFCLLFTGSVVSLWSFNISEAYRGKGIGGIILGHILADLKQQNRKKLVLYVKRDNLKAIKLYEKAGFKMVEQNDSTSLYMEHPLRHIKLGKLPHFAGNNEMLIYPQ